MAEAEARNPRCEDERAATLNRLRRAHGQLGGVIGMVEQNRGCGDVITQLAAVTKALNRAAFTIIAAGVRDCMGPCGEDGDGPTIEELERLFLSLA